ncbi:MAG: glycosyltransferase family 2 protein [Planctomycetaceae bacterium]|nr:glycosyltransferase family 2 protein [Planctomycetaceae bacterium]
MKISVALATYNGAEFIAEQLQSLASQQRLPDELVVCDDASSDDTAAIVRRFAGECPFDVRLEVNSRNLGVAGNFARAVSLCRGDVIALADQDDIWLPHKLARLEQSLADSPQLGYVFSDAELIDAEGGTLPRRLWESIGFNAQLQRRLNAGRAAELLVKRNLVTGAAMAFRAEYRDLLLPVGGHWLHDGWFALLLAAVAPCRALPEPLMKYRQHTGQQVGALKKSFFDRLQRASRLGEEAFLQLAADNDAARERLSAFRCRLQNAQLLRLLEEKADHLRTRARIRASRLARLPLMARELVVGRYARYSENCKAVLQDLLL